MLNFFQANQSTLVREGSRPFQPLFYIIQQKVMGQKDIFVALTLKCNLVILAELPIPNMAYLISIILVKRSSIKSDQVCQIPFSKTRIIGTSAKRDSST